MKKEIYENPKVEIVDLGTEDAICDSVVCARVSLNPKNLFRISSVW